MLQSLHVAAAVILVVMTRNEGPTRRKLWCKWVNCLEGAPTAPEMEATLKLFRIHSRGLPFPVTLGVDSSWMQIFLQRICVCPDKALQVVHQG